MARARRYARWRGSAPIGPPMVHDPRALVIFDCDGVLVDSEPISISVLLDVIRQAGGDISEEVAYLRFLGMSMASIGAILDGDFGFVMTDGHLATMRSELDRRFAAELRPIHGVADAIRAIAGPKCVASSSNLERIRYSLRTTGLLELLEPNIYSASMVKNGKPNPDLFLHAARAMDIEPAACVVIEDSPAGVTAAKRAGMRVFGFTGGSHAGKAGLAATLTALAPDAIFDDMMDLAGLLAKARSQAIAG